MAESANIRSVRKMSVEQRLRLMALICQTLEEEGEEIPVDPRDVAEMLRRAKELDEHPERAVSHEEMMARIKGIKWGAK